MYDIVDKLMLVIHQQQNYYHPKEHDNVMDVMYLEYQHVNINKNHILLDVLWRHQQLYPVEYSHFFHTKIKNIFVYLMYFFSFGLLDKRKKKRLAQAHFYLLVYIKQMIRSFTYTHTQNKSTYIDKTE